MRIPLLGAVACERERYWAAANCRVQGVLASLGVYVGNGMPEAGARDRMAPQLDPKCASLCARC